MGVLDLIKATTVSAFEQTCLKALGLAEFPTSWAPTSAPGALLYLLSLGLVEVWEVLSQLAASSFLSTAQGDWLRLLAREVYGVEWRPAVATRGTFVLSCLAGAGPVTFGPEELIATDPTGALFRNIAQVTVADGGTMPVLVTCVTPGKVGNITSSATLRLVTDVPGVVVSNPGAWVTVAGYDDESDDELKARCRAQWGRIELGTDAYYEQAARNASASVRKVTVRESTPGPGALTIVLAGASGTVSGLEYVLRPNETISPDVSTATGEVASKLKRALNDTVYIKPAYVRTIQIRGVVQLHSSHREAEELALATALGALESETPIGGEVLISEVIERVMSSGAKRFTPTSYADWVIRPDEVPVFQFDPPGLTREYV